MTNFTLDCAGRLLDLQSPKVMGVLNVTPDSFSDGGNYFADGRLDRDRALSRAAQMIQQGAAIIDVGGESTRPGAQPVGVAEELERVVPVVEALSSEFDIVISVDTSTPEVMREAAVAGAGLLNDVRALQRDGALEAAQATQLPVCLMHMQGEPQTMQKQPAYASVEEEVFGFLSQRIAACEQAGISRAKLLIDPGFGFGKSAEHNLRLLNRLSTFKALQLPILVGLSRKSLIGAVLGKDVNERLAGSIALASIAILHGAHIIRAHDIGETADAVRMAEVVLKEQL